MRTVEPALIYRHFYQNRHLFAGIFPLQPGTDSLQTGTSNFPGIATLYLVEFTYILKGIAIP